MPDGVTVAQTTLTRFV